MTVRFAFVADPQIGCMATFSGSDEAACERFRRRGMRVRPFAETTSIGWDTDRWTDTVDAVAARRPDFVVVGGDMVESIDRPEQLDAYRGAIASLDGLQVHHVPGNHDICSDKVIPTEESLEWYCDTFGDPHLSFTRDCGSGSTATFIVVNSPALQQPRRIPGVDDAELAFLEAELRAAGGRRGPIVVFSHHPPFLDRPDERDQYWNLPTGTRHQVLELCEEHGVSAIFAGHRHRNDRAAHGGTEIVTSSASGFPLGVDPPGYRMVEIDGDGIRHTYYGLGRPGWDAIGGAPTAQEVPPGTQRGGQGGGP